jgi:hypothetical protein
MSLEYNTTQALGNYIVDDIGAIVAKVRETWVTADSTLITADSTRLTADGGSAPYYMYGHKLEVAKDLLKKDKTYQKYPLVYLVMDFPETKQNRILSCTLNIGLIAFTKQEYNASQRYQNVFKPVLYPLYRKFMEELFKSDLFFWDGKDDQVTPEHTKIDRLFWGVDGEQNQTGQKKNSKYIFNQDPLDCIEIVGLKLNQSIKN